MELKTSRLSIRFINKNDWKNLIEIWNDFSNSEYAQYDVPHMGYAKESIETLIRYMSNGRKIRFTAGTALNNTPSVRLLLSLGFEKINEEQVSLYKDIYFKGGIFSLDVK